MYQVQVEADQACVNNDHHQVEAAREAQVEVGQESSEQNQAPGNLTEPAWVLVPEVCCQVPVVGD